MSTYKKPNMEGCKPDFDNCPPFLDRYLDYLATFNNKRPATVIEVYVSLAEFCQYIHYTNKIGQRPTVKDAHKDMDISCMPLDELACVSREQVEEYLCFLDTVVRNAVATVRKKLLFLRAFYAYLLKNAEELGVMLPNGDPVCDIPIPKAKSKPPLVLSQQQIDKLANSTTGENTLRDRAIILTLAATAITISELVNLTCKDFCDDTLQIVKDGIAQREVYLPAHCSEALRKYLLSREDPIDEAPLFAAGESKRHLTPRAIQERIKKAAKVAGMVHLNISAKSLRDTAAAALLRREHTPTTKAQILSYLGYGAGLSAERFTKGGDT